MEILHAFYVTCVKVQCQTLVVFLSVLRHLASVLWMYHTTINIHNIRSIDDGSMALMFIHNPEQQLFFYEQHPCNKHYANGLECIKL